MAYEHTKIECDGFQELCRLYLDIGASCEEHEQAGNEADTKIWRLLSIILMLIKKIDKNGDEGRTAKIIIRLR